MVLSEKDEKKIIDFVKKEPRTIQDIAKLLGKSWLTADSYVEKIKTRTGALDVKTFRAGTQGALKLVYFVSSDSLQADEVRENLLSQIRAGRGKSDFDFMEIFQFVPEKKKNTFLEEYADESISKNQNIISLFERTRNQILIFSGNLSFINMTEGKRKIYDALEEALARGVRLSILCRVNMASMSNIARFAPLMRKYPGQIEIHHRYQPLRGFLIDGELARFKDEELEKRYKRGELAKNTRVFYEVFDDEWVQWLERVFWLMFRSSIDYESRSKEIRKMGF